MKTGSSLHGLALMVLVIGALPLVLLGEGCSATPSSPGDTSETSTTITKPYGSLTMQADFVSGVIDPHQISMATFQPLGAAIFDSLVELNPEGQPIPGIAERWEIAPDGMTHTFYIRKGVKFHDGSDLTGADVKYSLERVLSPASTHNDGILWRAAVASVEMKDDYTVALHMKVPQFELLMGFTNLGGSPAVVPKKYIEEKGADYFGKQPVGSGPWKVLSYRNVSRLELEAVESHWRAVPKFKNLTLLAVPEEATRVAMLKTGELDMAAVSPDSVPGLKAAGLRTLSYNGGSQYVLYMFYDLDHPAQYPLGDVRVRKAMSLGINRQEMADQMMGGDAEPLALFMVPKTAYFADPNVVKPDPYDPEQAKKLLAEAGRPTGFNMKLWNAGAGSEGVLNLATAGYWRKIGINAEVIAKDTVAITAMYSPKHVLEIWNTAVGKIPASGAFGFERMNVYHLTKSTFHNNRNPRLDELIDKVPQTLDPTEKKRLAQEAVLLAKNDYAFMSVLSLHTVLAFGSSIGGMTTVANMAGNAYNFATISHAK